MYVRMHVGNDGPLGGLWVELSMVKEGPGYPMAGTDLVACSWMVGPMRTGHIQSQSEHQSPIIARQEPYIRHHRRCSSSPLSPLSPLSPGWYLLRQGVNVYYTSDFMTHCVICAKAEGGDLTPMPRKNGKRACHLARPLTRYVRSLRTVYIGTPGFTRGTWRSSTGISYWIPPRW